MENHPSKEEILQKFKEAFEREDHQRWRLYAERLLLITNGRETAMTGEDIISEVLDRILTDDRTFRNDITLNQFVYMTIKSIIDGEAKKDRRMVPDKFYEVDGINDNLNSIIDTTTRKTCVKPNEQLENDEFLNFFWTACEGDDEAQLVILEINEGNNKTSGIAKALGITPEKVTNIKKRIQRRVGRKQLK